MKRFKRTILTLAMAASLPALADVSVSLERHDPHSVVVVTDAGQFSKLYPARLIAQNAAKHIRNRLAVSQSFVQFDIDSEDGEEGQAWVLADRAVAVLVMRYVEPEPEPLEVVEAEDEDSEDEVVKAAVSGSGFNVWSPSTWFQKAGGAE